MTTFALTSRIELTSTANKALNAAARFWFIVAATGQWIFALYIAIVYGSSAGRGDWLAWSKHGYAAGHPISNTVLIAHLLFAAAISLSGALQLVPSVRARFPLFHRWNGRMYVLTAFIMGSSGLYLIWARQYAVGDLPQHIGVSINAILIVICAAMAWRTAMARDFTAHRRWALRLFLVVSGVWFFRVGLMFWLFINHGPAGFNPATFEGPFITLLSFAQYLLPLAALEIYLHAKERSGPMGRFATAGLLVVLTAVMGIGIVVATFGMWLPPVKRATRPRSTPTRHTAIGRSSHGFLYASELQFQTEARV